MNLILAYAIGGLMSTLGAFLAGTAWIGKDILKERKKVKAYADELIFENQKEKKDFIKNRYKKFNIELKNIFIA